MGQRYFYSPQNEGRAVAQNRYGVELEELDPLERRNDARNTRFPR